MESQFSKNLSNPLLLQLKDKPKPNFSIMNPSQSNTLLQFRSGITPKNKKNSEKLEYKCGSETSLHSFNKQLQFSKSPKADSKIFLSSNPPTTNRIQSKNFLQYVSRHSSRGQIQLQHDSSKVLKQNIDCKSKQQLPLKSIENNVNQKLKYKKSQSPSLIKSKPPLTLNRMLSNLQFGSNNCKLSNMNSKQNLDCKQQRTYSTLEFICKQPNFEKQIKQLREQLDIIKATNIKNNQIFIKEREEYQYIKQQFILQITALNQQVSQLNIELNEKELQFQQKSNMFLEQINQLIKDRTILQNKLLNVIIPQEFEKTEKDKAYKQIQQRLNYKDSVILDLQQRNNQLQSEINTLTFNLQNIKSRSQRLNPVNFSNQLSIFQQSLKYNLEQIGNLKQLLQFKDQQIYSIKQSYTIAKGQAEVARNQLSIQQLQRITEIQKLKVLFQAQKTSKNNQIRDLKQQTQHLKNKLISLSKQIKQKDIFIMSKVKVINN